jgi:hypothetical protein
VSRKLSLLLVALVFIAVFSTTNVFAIPVDLSAFDTVDPTVTLGPGISAATIYEDSTWAPVGLWESDLHVPADAMSLTFDYTLEVAPNNEDYFDFYFGDLSGPSDSFGGYNSSATDNLIYAGTIGKNLTGLAGGTLPIAFALNYGWDDGYDGGGNYVGGEFASVLTISNVKINPIPEPATLLLVSAGLIGMARIRKKLAA